MVSPLIATKLYIPKLRADAVERRRLKGRLDQGVHRKLSLISGSTGYGKTTLVSEWLSSYDRPVAWLSLDEEDNDINRFVSYLNAALRTIVEHHEWYASDLLQSPQSPPVSSIISVMINDLARFAEPIILVFDDYHVIRSQSIHDAVSLLLGHMPPNLHMVILTREEPDLNLARLRVSDEVTDIGVMDLRFNNEETALFLTHTMKLDLPLHMVSMLDERTEGWIAGLQIAALSMQGQQAVERFPSLIPGKHRVLFDYLVTEVLHKQPESVQKFLLYTSILDRFCSSLCNAVLLDDSSIPGDHVVQTLESANLFIVPLDHEQHWYRYHHLFAELLRHQLQQRIIRTGEIEDVAVLHHRASVWYEKNGFNLEAFRHAVAANDIEMASLLAEGNDIPLHLQGDVVPVLNWLESLPRTELDARPSLWVIYASALLMAGRPTDVESKLLAAEAVLPSSTTDTKSNNLLGLIATTRAAVAAIAFSGHSETTNLKLQAAEDALQTTNTIDKTNELIGQIIPSYAASNKLHTDEVDVVITQCNLALEYLDPNFLPVRMTALWMLGVAYQLCEKHSEAHEAYIEVLLLSRKMGGNIIEVMANVGLGRLMETENQLYEAEEYYRRALFTNGNLPLPAICEAYLGLARICYVWHDLETSMRHVKKSIQLALQADNKDIIVSCHIMIARIQLAQQDWKEASTVLADAKKFARQHRLLNRMPEIEEVQVTGMLLQREPPEHIEPLTQRELEVLRLISLGYSNQEIGKKLFLALDSVKGHNRRIFAKLQVERRTEAVAIARKLGWIE
ncbi:MAG TPA: LuxR C-terminal-related transcriptional regulator [Candidatus Paenibacillus intestinavium]|nr:LuxR C-terminal-related transcriptional regulator [Candidatus Paenibacillus intestinavium]